MSRPGPDSLSVSAAGPLFSRPLPGRPGSSREYLRCATLWTVAVAPKAPRTPSTPAAPQRETGDWGRKTRGRPRGTKTLLGAPPQRPHLGQSNTNQRSPPPPTPLNSGDDWDKMPSSVPIEIYPLNESFKSGPTAAAGDGPGPAPRGRGDRALRRGGPARVRHGWGAGKAPDKAALRAASGSRRS